MIPDSVITVILDSNKFAKLPKLSANLIHLDIARNQLTNIDDIPETVEELDFSMNEVESVKKFPSKLTNVKGYYNKIKYVISLPETLKYLDMSHNEIMFVPMLPQGIEKVDFANNNIKYMNFTKLPPKLKQFDLRENSEMRNAPLEITSDQRVLCDRDNNSDISVLEGLFCSGSRVSSRDNMSYREQLHQSHDSGETLRLNLQTSREPSEYSGENPHYIMLTKRKVI